MKKLLEHLDEYDPIVLEFRNIHRKCCFILMYLPVFIRIRLCRAHPRDEKRGRNKSTALLLCCIFACDENLKFVFLCYGSMYFKISSLLIGLDGNPSTRQHALHDQPETL